MLALKPALYAVLCTKPRVFPRKHGLETYHMMTPPRVSPSPTIGLGPQTRRAFWSPESSRFGIFEARHQFLSPRESVAGDSKLLEIGSFREQPIPPTFPWQSRTARSIAS